MKKKTFSHFLKTRYLTKLLVAMCIIVVSIGCLPVSAATVKLNKQKATMEKDSTLTLILDGTSSQVTWKSSNKSIASVTKKGKVTAVAEGVATITANYNGSKYTCTVTVVDSNKGSSKAVVKFNASDVLKKIKTTGVYEYNDSWGWFHDLFVVVKNTSDYTVELEGKVKFYDSDKNLIGYSSSSEHAVGPNEELCFTFNNEEAFSSYEITWSVSEEKYYSPVCGKISLDVTKAKEKAIIEATNNGEIPAEFVEYTALFFENGKVIGYDDGYLVDSDYEIKPGQSEMREADCYDYYDDVKVYITGRGTK